MKLEDVTESSFGTVLKIPELYWWNMTKLFFPDVDTRKIICSNCLEITGVRGCNKNRYYSTSIAKKINIIVSIWSQEKKHTNFDKE